MHKDILRINSRGGQDRRDMKGLRNTDSPKSMETRAIGEMQKEFPVCLMRKNPERERTGRVLKGRAPGIDGGQPGMMAVPLIHQDRVVIPDSRKADNVNRKDMKRPSAGWMRLKRS